MNTTYPMEMNLEITSLRTLQASTQHSINQLTFDLATAMKADGDSLAPRHLLAIESEAQQALKALYQLRRSLDERIGHVLAESANSPLVVHGPLTFLEANQHQGWQNSQGGVYLWCVRNAQGEYLIYYVGKAAQFTSRHSKHISNFNKGAYSIHDLAKLKAGQKELVHAANSGFIKDVGMSYQAYLERMYSELVVFYITLDTEDQAIDLEARIAAHLKNRKPSILDVHERFSGNLSTHPVAFNTQGCFIAGITNEVIC